MHNIQLNISSVPGGSQEPQGCVVKYMLQNYTSMQAYAINCTWTLGQHLEVMLRLKQFGIRLDTAATFFTAI